MLRELEKALREKVKLSASRASGVVDFILGEATEVVDKAEPAKLAIDADDALVLGRRLPATPSSSLPATPRRFAFQQQLSR